MTLRWFVSKTVRQAAEMRRQVRRLLNEQRDLLSADAIAKLEAAISKLDASIRSATPKAALLAEMEACEKAAVQLIKPYPNPGLRENIKELLVAITVILGITTFFLQLTKIPTGSMQPTLYGITHEDIRGTGESIPGRVTRFVQYWVRGISYHHLVAKADGELRQVSEPQILLPFIKKQRLLIGDQWHTLWLPPDRLVERASLSGGKIFKRGEDVLKLKTVAGDHLFVDRFTYNFRRPHRGEIIVFKTRGIEGLPQDQLYIKRLVALEGERVRVGNDSHLIIDDRRISAGDRHFEFVYNFKSTPEDGYLGHVNETTARERGRFGLAPLFPNEKAEFKVEENHYMAMGDNTFNSLDSRTWGDFPQKNVIGRCWFVYWPITKRFGWGYR